MARPLRLEFPGGIYHVTARGNARTDIFLKDEIDGYFWISCLECVIGFGSLCHADCLMGNHYHLPMETPVPNLSAGMRRLNGIYTQRFNRGQVSFDYCIQDGWNKMKPSHGINSPLAGTV